MLSVLQKIKPRSLRIKLLLWYSIVFMVCGAGLVTAIYFFAARELKAEADKFLHDETKEFERQARDRMPDIKGLRDYLDLEIGQNRWFKPFYRIVDVNSGHVLLLMPPRAPDIPVNFPREKRNLVDTVVTGGGLNETYRIRTRLIDIKGKTVALQCGFLFGRLYERLERLRFYLFISIAATIITASGGGLLLSSRSLKPMTNIINDLRDIRASNLYRRLPEREVQDEVRQLTDVINQMLDELETAFNYMRSFTGDVAHELRTPLATIRCELEVAVVRKRDAEEYRENLGSVLDRIKKLSDTVENMLFLARADSCSHPPGRREIDLASVLCEIGDTFEMSAEAKDIELRVDLQRPLLLTANAEWIKLAFANLFDNAIKYTPRKGRVSVSAESKEGEVIVCISDTGPGIEDSQKKKIFDRFYRSRDGAYGSGLGLSITRRVFELHEGRIIERGKPGEGAVFEVRLRR